MVNVYVHWACVIIKNILMYICYHIVNFLK